MSAHLLSVTGVTEELIVGVLAVVTTASASVVKKWIEETFRTRRVVKSLEDAKPQQRPEIIRAWGQLEGRATSKHPDADTAAGHPLPGETLHAIDADGAEQSVTPQALRGTGYE